MHKWNVFKVSSLSNDRTASITIMIESRSICAGPNFTTAEVFGFNIIQEHSESEFICIFPGKSQTKEKREHKKL